MFQTAVTMCGSDPALFFYFFHKGIQNRTSRHSHRTFYDHNIFFSGIQICFFIANVCVTFFRCNESGCHLYRICPKGKCMCGAFAVMNSSTDCYRNLLFVFIRIVLYDFFDFLNLLIVYCLSFIFIQLIFTKSQMSPGKRSFDHYQIRYSLIFFIPVL